MAYRNRSRKPAREVTPSPLPPKTPEQLAAEEARRRESEAARAAYPRREEPDWHLWRDRLGGRVAGLRLVLPPWCEELPALPSRDQRMAFCESVLENNLPLGPLTLWERRREGEGVNCEYVVLGGLEMCLAFGLPIWHGEESWKVEAPVWHVQGVKLSWEEPDGRERFALMDLARGRSEEGESFALSRAENGIWLVHAVSYLADVSVHLSVLQRSNADFARLVWERLDGKAQHI